MFSPQAEDYEPLGPRTPGVSVGSADRLMRVSAGMWNPKRAKMPTMEEILANYVNTSNQIMGIVEVPVEGNRHGSDESSSEDDGLGLFEALAEESKS